MELKWGSTLELLLVVARDKDATICVKTLVTFMVITVANEHTFVGVKLKFVCLIWP